MLEAIETEETELHFASKKVTINEVNEMLENQGWTLNQLHFVDKNITASEARKMLEDQGWTLNK